MVKEQQKRHCCNAGGRTTAEHNLQCKELGRLLSHLETEPALMLALINHHGSLKASQEADTAPTRSAAKETGKVLKTCVTSELCVSFLQERRASTPGSPRKQPET